MLIIDLEQPTCQAANTAPVAEDLTEVNRPIDRFGAIIVTHLALKEVLRLQDLGLVHSLGLERPGRLFGFEELGDGVPNGLHIEPVDLPEAAQRFVQG